MNLSPLPRNDDSFDQPRSPQRGVITRWWMQVGLLVAIGVLVATHMRLPTALAQDQPPADAPAAPAPGPAAAARDPILDNDGELEARSALSWREGAVRWVLLTQDVRFSIGTYGFRADRALVRIEPERRPGQTVHHVALYLDNARTLGRGRVDAEAPRLLVTVSTRGDLELSTDLFTPVQRAPADQPFVADGLQRIGAYLQAMSREMAPLAPGPRLSDEDAEAARRAQQDDLDRTMRDLRGQSPGDPPSAREREAQAPTDPQRTPLPPGSLPPRGAGIDPADEPAAPVRRGPIDRAVVSELEDQRILPARGLVSFNYDRIESAPLDEDSRYIALMGGVEVMYQEFEGEQRFMTLTAENAVIFVNVGRIEDVFDGRTIDARDITGIYLEDNVSVSDGLYTVRAPRVFIDPKNNKAVVLDAVVYTVDVRRRIPLYLRADQLRQASRTSWSGRNVTLTTSEFAEPHFAIRSGRLQFEQTGDEATGTARQSYDAQDNVFTVGPLPVFYWPRLAGDVGSAPPLERIRVGYRKRDGHFEPEIETRWNLFALAGYEPPDGVALSGDLDYRGDHGVGLGLSLRYDVPNMFGRVDGYLLPYDTGTDRIGNRNDVGFDGETRGYLSLKHRQYLRHDLELSLELGYASDPTFLEEFFPDEAYIAKPYETSIYFKQQENDRAFTLLAKYNVNDFLPQLTELQAPGYFVEKLPELTYRQIGTSFFDDRLTYFTENRLSRMRIKPGDDALDERGFGTRASAELFGMTPTQTFSDAVALAGIPRDYRLRFDSRHEVQAPARLGIVDIVPYIVGRITAYDDDFEDFSGEEDNYRLWGQVGTRLHTQFSRTYSQVENRLLDLHRLRHIIEPSANIFFIGSTIDADALPVYDPDVEAIQRGFGTRLGIRNTFQTQRGGEGAWRSVDWLVIDTNYVYRSDDADVRTDIARFFDYRPEYSVGGEHIQNDIRWAVTDSFAIVGDVTYSLEDNDVPLWHLGAQIQHTPRFSTFLEYAEIELIDSRLLTWGANYILTPKYSLGYRQRLNLGQNDTQDLTFTVERRLPQWRILVQFRHDAINDEQTVGIALVPELFSGPAPTPSFGQ